MILAVVTVRTSHHPSHPESGDTLKLLLTSAGVKNASIRNALVDLVDFSICPHVNGDDKPGNTMAEAEQWAAGISGPAYVIDDDTAIQVVDGTVDVVSEGHWKLL